MKKFILIGLIVLAAITAAYADVWPEYSKEQIDSIETKGLLKNEEYFQKDYILEVIWIPYSIKSDYYGTGGFKPTNVKEDEEFYGGWALKVLHVYKGKNVKEGDTIVALVRTSRFYYSYEIRERLPNEDEFSGRAGPIISCTRCYINGKPAEDFDTPGISISRDFSTIIFGNYMEEFPACFDQSRNDHYLKIKIQNKKRAGLFWVTEDKSMGPGSGLTIRVAMEGLNGLRFNSRNELYKYMEQFPEITIPGTKYQMQYILHDSWYYENRERLDKTPEELHRESKQEVERMQEMKRKRAKEYKDSLDKNQGYLNAPKSNNNLSLSIQNMRRTTSNNKYYLEFDVYAWSNVTTTYLDNVAIKQ